jgi:opacity protein-like surface antigen
VFFVKYYVAGCLLSSGALAANAQAPADARPARKLPVSFGLRLGLNYSNTNFNLGEPKPVVPVETKWKTGFVAGGLVEIALNEHLALQQEYLYSQQSGEVTTGARYQLHYLSLPLLLKYRVLPRLAVVAGPQLDLLLKAQQEANGQTTTITHDTEERGFGATAGLEVTIWRSLGLSARYLQGLNHVGIGQRSAVQEFKWQSVQVAAEVRF